MVLEDYRHAVEQTFLAVRELALGVGRLQERLEGACDGLLSLESKELPEALRAEFLVLINDLTQLDELGSLADADAVALALRLLTLHERLLLS